jgi:hypothetical protein
LQGNFPRLCDSALARREQEVTGSEITCTCGDSLLPDTGHLDGTWRGSSGEGEDVTIGKEQRREGPAQESTEAAPMSVHKVGSTVGGMLCPSPLYLPLTGASVWPVVEAGLSPCKAASACRRPWTTVLLGPLLVLTCWTDTSPNSPRERIPSLPTQPQPETTWILPVGLLPPCGRDLFPPPQEQRCNSH